MNTIDKKELYEHLGSFLKAKGIELKDGSYAQGIEKACGFLTDAINLGQMGLERAKTGLDRRLDQVRQVIHEKTAPKKPAGPPASPPPPAAQSPASQTTAAARGRQKPLARKRPKVRRARK